MLVLTIYTLTFALGLPTNLFAFVTLLAKLRRRPCSSSDVLLLNLTAADLLLLLFLPFKMAEAAAGMTWPLPVVLCPLANYCFYSSIYLSSLFLAALSVERYLSVVFPVRYRRRPGRAAAASALLWLLACSHCSVVLVSHFHREAAAATNGSAAHRSPGAAGGGGRGPGVQPERLELGGSTVGGLGVEGSISGGFEPGGPITGGLGLEGSISGGFKPGGSISGGFKPKRPSPHPMATKTVNSDGSVRGGSRISGLNSPKFSKPNGSVSSISRSSKTFDPNSSQTSNPETSNLSGPKTSNLSGPKTSNPTVSMSNSSNPRSSKTSNISNLKTSNPRSSNPRSSKTSNISTLSSPKFSNLELSSPTPSWTSSPPPAPYKCYDDFSPDQLLYVLPLRLELFLVLFLLPFAVTVFCYVSLVRVLLARPHLPPEKKQRAVGLAVVTMVNYGLCFAPYNLSHLVGFLEKKSPPWRVYALLLTSLNATLDPVVFYFSSTAVRQAVARLGEVLQAWGRWVRGALGCGGSF